MAKKSGYAWRRNQMRRSQASKIGPYESKIMMKKTITLLLAVILAAGTSMTAEAKFKIGPRLGINVNKLSFNKDLFDGANRCGFTGGVQAEYMLPIISLGFDLSLMYSYMDYDVNVGTSQYNVSASSAFKPGKHFLEIPLNIKYKISIPAVAKIIKPYIFTGPQVAFKLDKDDTSLKTKTSQWVWNFGLGLELIDHLQIGASYGVGMNNIMDGLDTPVGTIQTEDLKARTNYWTVTAAWLF